MDAKNLMLGDIVGIEYYATGAAIDGVIKAEKKTMPCKVVRIDDYKVTVDRLDGKAQESLVIDLIPIPLTEDIIKTNGFENDFYEEESVADYHTIRFEGYSLKCEAIDFDDALVTWCNGKVEIYTDFHGCFQMEDMKFVHQLQHALRLCGIKHEIVL